MLYLKIQDPVQTLFIPRSVDPDGGRENLTLRLRRGGVEKTFQGLADLNLNSRYYVIDIEGAADLVTGEYDYSLEAETGDVLSEGIVTAGDYVREVKDVPGERKIIEYGN